MRYWVIRAGEGGKYFDEFIKRGKRDVSLGRSGSHHDILFVISELRQYMALKTALRAIFAPKNRV